MVYDFSLYLTDGLLLTFSFFFFNDTATTEIYTLSLHDALPIFVGVVHRPGVDPASRPMQGVDERGVDQGLLLPQNGRTGILERVQGAQRVGSEQHAPRQRRPGAPESLHDPVVESVHGTSAAAGAAVPLERRE